MANSSTFNGKLEPSLQISDPHTGSAKDDNVTLSPTNTFTLDDILGNDPGSAIFQPGSIVVTGAPGSGIYYDADLGIFHVTGDVTSFEYTIQMANGSYSTATVTLDDGGAGTTAGPELFSETFDGYQIVPLFGADLGAKGWDSTNTVELVWDGYKGIVGPDGGSYWLDTQASPGAIDISHDVVDPNGGSALLSFTAAYQQFDSWVVTGALQFLWNGEIVKTLSADEFPAANQFLDFSVVVDSNVGVNTLEIIDTGTASFVGFALDSVTVNDWIIV